MIFPLRLTLYRGYSPPEISIMHSDFGWDICLAVEGSANNLYGVNKIKIKRNVGFMNFMIFSIF